MSSFFLLLISLLDGSGLSIRITPQVVMRGAAMRLTCRVDQDPRNRVLEYGIDGYTRTQMDLDGEHSRVTFERIIERIPCDVGPAYCALYRNEGKPILRSINFEIANCDPMEQKRR